MIRIGFDDDELDDEFDESGEPKVNHGDKVEFEKKRSIYIPEKRLNEIKKELDCVVVHEYGDEYHLSEQERLEKNSFYEAFKVFRKCKHNYRDLSMYVSAMREALKCLDFVANENGVYEPDEFKKLFLRGKIYINGLKFPKFKGRDRKSISWDYLTEFILSDADPKEILPKDHSDDIITDDEFEEKEKEMFAPGELEKILEPESEDEEYQERQFFDVDEDDQSKRKGLAVFLDQKQIRKISKTQPELLYTLKESQRKKRSIENLDRFAFNLMDDDLSEIAANDQKYKYTSDSDIPEFKGDIMNDNDYNKYLQKLEEYEDTQIRQVYGGRLKTRAQIRELELKQQLENDGWNLRNLYDNKEKEERLKRAAKQDKKREKELKRKLVDVQKRRRRKLGQEVDDDDEKVSKKKSCGKKHKKPKKNKEINKYKKEASEQIDEFLLNAAERTDHDFDEYEENVLDWSSENIFGER